MGADPVAVRPPEAEEAQAPKVPRTPATPTVDELKMHNVSHLPFRAWCAHCVAGRGTSVAHRMPADKQYTKPVVAADYAFLSGSAEAGHASESPVLVLKCRDTKMIFSRLLPSKGLSHPYNAKAAAECLKQLGWRSIIIKTDGEPAIKALMTAAVAEAGIETFAPESSSAGESEENGLAERAVRTVQEQGRVLLSALVSHLGKQIPTNHPILA